MNDSFPYPGRHVAPDDTEPDLIKPDPGNVLALVVRVAEFELVNLYAKQAIINRWGIRLIKPFRRLSRSDLQHDYAEFLGKEIHVFCPARIQMIPEEYWMLRVN